VRVWDGAAAEIGVADAAEESVEADAVVDEEEGVVVQVAEEVDVYDDDDEDADCSDRVASEDGELSFAPDEVAGAGGVSRHREIAEEETRSTRSLTTTDPGGKKVPSLRTSWRRRARVLRNGAESTARHSSG
jgi:hypothetical protein